MPAREFLVRLAERSLAEFVDDHCSQYASSIAYHVLFSIFPLALVLAGVFGIVLHATGTRGNVVDTIVGYVPLSESGDAELRKLLDGATSNLSALGLVGFVGLIYAASGMMASIRLALNVAWDVRDYRPFLRGKLIDLGLVFVSALLALISLGITIGVRTLGNATKGGSVDLGARWASVVLGILVPLGTGFAVVLFLYRVVPAVEVRVADAWPGALLAAAAFVVMENLFAVYVQHFTNYNAIYGSLGAVIAFMFFVYISSLSFLFGAEVASEWPRVRERLAREDPDAARDAGGDENGSQPVLETVKGLVKGLWTRPEERR